MLKNAKSTIVEGTSVRDTFDEKNSIQLTSTKMPDCDQTEGNFQESSPNRDASDVENAKSSIVEATPIYDNLNQENGLEYFKDTKMPNIDAIESEKKQLRFS